MFGLRLPFAVVILGLVVCLVGVGGVLWQDYAAKRAFAEGVQKCVADVARRDPTLAAERALRQRDDHFQFVWDHRTDIDIMYYADGVVAGEKWGGVCRPTKAAFAIPMSPFANRWHFAYVQPVHIPGVRLTTCGTALEDYSRRYNAEMARISPQSVAKYCTN